MSLIKRLFKIVSANFAQSEDSIHDRSEFDGSSQPKYDGQNMNSSHESEEMKYRANLEVGPNDDIVVIRKQYKLLLKKYHPDLHAGSSEKSELAKEITQGLNEAMNYFEKKQGES